MRVTGIKQQDKTVGIVGVGNLLFADEGFGIHALRYLDTHFRLPDIVSLLDGGTAGIMLSSFFEESDYVFVIDAVETDSEPGTVHTFDLLDDRAINIHVRMSPHQVGLLETIEICKLKDTFPQRIELIGVVPSNLSTGIELSPVTAPRVAEVAGMICDRLRALGVPMEGKG